MTSTVYTSINDAAPNLIGISRVEQREKTLGSRDFSGFGTDVWRTSELTWLDLRGKPKRGDLTISVPCDSPKMVESKSLKLYLMSFAMSAFESKEHVKAVIVEHLNGLLGCSTEVNIDTTPIGFKFDHTYIDCSHRLDYIPLRVMSYNVNRDLLVPQRGADRSSGRYHTDLFRCLCPVTSQPDYATVVLTLTDAWVSADSLLAYLVGYRTHLGFHESTVERIFDDVTQICQPSEISVLGSFARRGGIDICPFRSSRPEDVPNWRSNIS